MRDFPLLRNRLWSICLIVMFFSVGNMHAQNVGDGFNDGVLDYRITSVNPNTVEVLGHEVFTGEVNLDISSVQYKGVSFLVTAIESDVFRESPEEGAPHYIKTAVFPNVTTISSGAFKHCSSLTSVSFPEATTIGDHAFLNCSSLTSASFPQVIGIGDWAFYNCTSLTSASFPQTTGIGTNAFYNCTSLTLAFLPMLTSISESAFYNCTSLTSASFPQVIGIGESAFYNCTSLTSISFPIATIIGGCGFYDCGLLSTASFPEVVTIGGRAFDKCSSLTSVSFPKVTTMGDGAFSGCSSLTTVSFPEVTTLGSVMMVSTGTFSWCTSLTTASFPKTTIIGTGTFAGCSSLTTISFPEVTTIARDAFWGCVSLTSVSFPKATDLGPEAFLGCSSLKTVVFPETIMIGEDAFTCCTSLQIANFPKATSIGREAFRDCTSLNSAIFPQITITEEGSIFQGCTSLTLVSFPKLITLKSYGGGEFSACTALTTVIFPELTNIGGGAFLGCTSLATAIFPKANKIGCFAFSDCEKLTVLSFGAIPPALPETYEDFEYENPFRNCPTPRYLTFVDADGVALTGTDLSTAMSNYKAVEDGSTTDNLWHGWTISSSNKNIAAASVETTDGPYTFTGSVIEPAYSIAYKGHSLILNTDYTVAYKDNINAGNGTGKIIIVGIGDYIGTKVVTFDIDRRSLDDVNISVETQAYTGSQIQPDNINAAFTYNSVVVSLMKGTDYEVKDYGANTIIGKNIGSMIVKGIGNYKDEKTVSFDIGKLNLADVNVAIKGIPFEYTGIQITPKVEVSYKGSIISSSEYAVSYGDNINVGKDAGSITITSNSDNSEGEKTVTFDIISRDLSKATVTLSNYSFVSTGSQIKPGVTVTLNGSNLIENTDYTISYGTNIDKGTGTVTINGIGIYSGSKSVGFTIYARSTYVIMPKVAGVLTDPSDGLSSAEIGQPFVFRVYLDPTLKAGLRSASDYEIIVQTDRETLYPFDVDHYRIDCVDHETHIYITLRKINTTAVDAIDALTVYGGQGVITILSPESEDLYIVDMSGVMIKATTIPSGKTVINGLAKGVYIVKIGDETRKVFVK